MIRQRLKYKLRLLVILGLVCCCVHIIGQELPPIINYPSESYSGANQNWAITQSDEQYIYVANNDGLLEFNGASWNLYPSPNKTIVRSVCAINDSIYTGSYMDFGYWIRNAKGILEYRSLAQELDIELIEDEQFWNIIPLNDWILFQSLDRIYSYNTSNKKLNTIDSDRITNKIFKVEDVIYFQVLNEGLYTIENGDKRIVSDDVFFKMNVLIDIFEEDGSLVVVTQNNGFHLLNGTELSKWDIIADTVLKDESIYNSRKLKNGSILVGTIANGVFLLSSEGEILYHINQVNGLGNNTALSLFEDLAGNIWVGLDNGITCINLNSPIKRYDDIIGRLGTVYASTTHQNNLYLGTNLGLFYKPYGSVTDFKFVKGTEGQVWSLNVIGEDLFCGHNSGTFLVNDNESELIVDVMGTWDIKPLKDSDNELIQGNYSGIYVLKKQNGRWELRNKVSGFDISSKHFEQVANNKILVSHEYKGIYSLNLDEDLSTVFSYERIEKFCDGANSSLVNFDGNISYGCVEGVFQYNKGTQLFEKNEMLSKIYANDEYVSGKLVPESNQRLWAFTKNYINYITPEKISDDYLINSISFPKKLRNEKKGYENISKMENDLYLLGSASGYILVDFSNSTNQRDYEVSLTSVVNSGQNGSSTPVSTSGNVKFKANDNNFRFSYSVPEYDKYSVVEYQYSLDGRSDNKWSSWSTNSSKSFENLRFGDYEFKVKARVNHEEVGNMISYQFTIKRPWYLSNLALIAYLISAIIIFRLMNTYYKRNYRKERARLMDKTTREMELKELEAQKEIIQLKNESLKQDIEARNRELAISTMSMIKKNNALSEIKEELSGLKEMQGVKPVVNLINKTLNDVKDWKFFEEAFNHADKDFFKKVKQIHPELTANDLRLCVYLRLNLASKEIAPLLNISPRSVEIKRYRLRKKIGVDREINLNDYFINL